MWRHRPSPMRGPPSVAGAIGRRAVATRPEARKGFAPFRTGQALYGDVVLNRHGGAPEGVRAARHAGTLRKGARLRRSADRRSASLTHVRDKEEGRRRPRAGWEGADESRLYGC